MSLFEEKKEVTVFEFGIDETARAYMLETARWTKFMAIMGFIVTGILLIAGLLLAVTLSGAAGQGIQQVGYATGYRIGLLVVYALFSLLYVYPIVCLLKFSTNIKRALNNNDVQLFNQAMKYQRNMWRFTGILMIVLMVLYGVVIVFYGLLAAR